MNGDAKFSPRNVPGAGPVSLDTLMAPASVCSPHPCAPPTEPDSDAPC